MIAQNRITRSRSQRIGRLLGLGDNVASSRKGARTGLECVGDLVKSQDDQGQGSGRPQHPRTADEVKVFLEWTEQSAQAHHRVGDAKTEVGEGDLGEDELWQQDRGMGQGN